MKFSENLAYIFEQNFKNFTQNVWIQALAYKDKICSDWPTALKKSPNLVRPGRQALKTAKFVQTGQSGLKNCPFCSD